MTRSYKHIRRDNARQYPHQVRLTHARLWRMDHVDAQVRHLEPRQWTWWHEGDEGMGMTLGSGVSNVRCRQRRCGTGQRAAALIGASRPNSRPIGRQHSRKTSGSFTGQST